MVRLKKKKTHWISAPMDSLPTCFANPPEREKIEATWRSSVGPMSSTSWLFCLFKKTKLITESWVFSFPLYKLNTQNLSTLRFFFGLFLLSLASHREIKHTHTQSMERAIPFLLVVFLSQIICLNAEEAFDVRQHLSTLTRSFPFSCIH